MVCQLAAERWRMQAVTVPSRLAHRNPVPTHRSRAFRSISPLYRGGARRSSQTTEWHWVKWPSPLGFRRSRRSDVSPSTLRAILPVKLGERLKGLRSPRIELARGENKPPSPLINIAGTVVMSSMDVGLFENVQLFLVSWLTCNLWCSAIVVCNIKSKPRTDSQMSSANIWDKKMSSASSAEWRLSSALGHFFNYKQFLGKLVAKATAPKFEAHLFCPCRLVHRIFYPSIPIGCRLLLREILFL